MNEELIKQISDSLIRMRYFVATKFVRRMKEVERTTFPPGFLQIMGILLSNETSPKSMTELSISSAISKPNITTIIDRLCLEGFAERSMDLTDRRVVKVALTKTGLDFLAQHKAMVESFMTSQLYLLNEEELLTLKQAINDMNEILQVMEERSGK